MTTTNPRLHGAALAALVVTLLVLAAAPVVAASAEVDTGSVRWHPRLGSAEVDGATATVVRRDTGVSYRLQTQGLTPGHAYTLWFVAIDAPEHCGVHPEMACIPPDVMLNQATDGQVRWGGGAIAGASGRLTFAGHQSVGPMDGWLDDRSLDNPFGAEFHLVVNDHGPALAEYLPDMIHTYRGGCADAPTSLFSLLDPPVALADGAVGPNTCQVVQIGIVRP